MPLKMQRGWVPRGWIGAAPVRTKDHDNRASSIKVALINNMPDSAFEDTGRQFFTLLSAAAGDAQVSLHLYSLPEIARGERVITHFNEHYGKTDELFNDRFDGVIITGTEPLRKT